MILLVLLLVPEISSSRAGSSACQESSQPVVISHPLPAYPAIAAAKKERGKVLIDVKIDSAGKVVSATIIKGPPILSKFAREKALEWRFNEVAKEAGLRPARLTFMFHPRWHRALTSQPKFTPPFRADIIWDPIIDCFGDCGKKKSK